MIGFVVAAILGLSQAQSPEPIAQLDDIHPDVLAAFEGDVWDQFDEPYGDIHQRYQNDPYFRQRVNYFLCSCEPKNSILLAEGDPETEINIKTLFLYIYDDGNVPIIEESNQYSIARFMNYAGVYRDSTKPERSELDLFFSLERPNIQDNYRAYNPYCSWGYAPEGKIETFFWGDVKDLETSKYWAECFAFIMLDSLNFTAAAYAIGAESVVQEPDFYFGPSQLFLYRSNVIGLNQSPFLMCPATLRGIFPEGQVLHRDLLDLYRQLTVMQEQIRPTCNTENFTGIDPDPRIEESFRARNGD